MERRKQRGPKPLAAKEKRTHTVSVRLNRGELARLDAKRGPVAMQRGEWLRTAALHRLPVSIPELNREAWAELAKSAANLNQLARKLNEGQRVGIEEVKKVLGEFRRDLIGARVEHES